MNNCDHVGYEIDNTYEPDSDLYMDSEVNAAMGPELNQTEDSMVSNNWDSEIGVDDTHPILDFIRPLNVLGNRKE